jgi:hypothetical protein
MKNSERAKEVLTTAESGLRALIAEAAQRGDYSSIEVLAGWASTISDMIGRSTHAPTNSTRPVTPSNPAVANNGSARNTPQKGKRKKKRKAKSSYPRFARSGDNLVKVAWSKSQKSEYRHKAPHAALLKLAATLDQRMIDGAVISMDDILPLSADDGSEIPDYQSYLCLAWLRSIGVVDQQGREGYVLGDGQGSVVEQAKTAWPELPVDAKK